MRIKNYLQKVFFLSITLLLLPGATMAMDIGGIPDSEVIKGLYPGKAYSPYAQRSFPSRVYWGETHLHTGLSLDAGLFGCTLGHEDAYRLARGEEIKSSTGLPVKLSRPLDWIVITDHSDMMGIATDIQRGAPNIMADPKGKEWAEGFQKGGEAAHRTELKENIYNELRGRYTIVFEQQTGGEKTVQAILEAQAAQENQQ